MRGRDGGLRVIFGNLIAVTEFSPSQISVGNVNSVPPPATEFMAPAIRPAPKDTAPCVKSMAMRGFSMYHTVRIPVGQNSPLGK